MRTAIGRHWALMLLAAPAVACACGDDPVNAATSSGGAGGATTVSSSTSSGLGASTSSSSSSSTGSGGVIAQPCPDWDGWETWDDFAASGPFCVPASADALPEPISWEPCDAIMAMPAGCQQMSITWPASFPHMASTVSGWVEPDGRVLLSFTRNALAANPRWRMLVVAEADGPVHIAFANTNFDHPTWKLVGSSQAAGVRQGRYIFKVQRKDIVQDFEEAIVGGALGELHPKPLHVWDPSNGHAFAAASGLWATRDPSEIRFAKWGEPLGSPITSGEVGGGELQSLFPLGDMLFFKRQPFPSADIWAYKEGVGAYPLVAFGGDPDKNIDGFGTDGTHMAWVETQVNWPPDVTPFEVGPRDVMVSPYAETAAGLAPVRLRSFPSIYPLTSAMAVGCGYAAHGGIEDGKGWLFRLSDGYSWQLPMAGCTPPNLSNDVCLNSPLAITCDEVFVQAVGKVQTIVRLSINALGPPTPPD